MSETAESQISLPRHIRCSLARGYAREAFEQAARCDGKMVSLIEMLAPMRHNVRNRVRTATRLRKLPGVLRVVARSEGLSIVLRTRREMILRNEDGECFREDILMYTRVIYDVGRRGGEYSMSRVSFSRHAMERLVQRSVCRMESLLSHIDLEAIHLLTAEDAVLCSDASRAYRRALCQGVWAGCQDKSESGPHWPLGYRNDADRWIPTFSARTFLSPAEMDPVTWLRWQGDEHLAMVG